MRDAPYVYRARALARANAGDLEGAQEDRQKAASLEQFQLRVVRCSIVFK